MQYYSLASQVGEAEADLALSRWFLCGSEGTGNGDGFKRDEGLAFIFGEKAAKKGEYTVVIPCVYKLFMNPYTRFGVRRICNGLLLRGRSRLRGKY